MEGFEDPDNKFVLDNKMPVGRSEWWHHLICVEREVNVNDVSRVLGEGCEIMEGQTGRGCSNQDGEFLEHGPGILLRELRGRVLFL